MSAERFRQVEGDQDDDPAPDARALRLLGADPWDLKIVRELLFGPRTEREVRRALPDPAAGVLPDRLEQLVTRGIAGPSAGSEVRYGLTTRGAGLRATLVELVRWGHHLPVTVPGATGAAATLLELLAWYRPLPGHAAPGRVTLRLAADSFEVEASADGVEIRRGPGTALAGSRLTTDVATLRAVLFGPLSLAAALEHRMARLDGSAAPLYALAAVLPRPVRVPAQPAAR
ncbi:winged helix-turn-helix transcriptional regulator [Actinoplanes sp. M2I2]|uniref:winged helix-turn-helix transcriptional regulator n=1 Tax=Actinoplanes sp. M2I2 TaxID=1734444 RepID=UPI002020534C|nr:winged helix-turn-helix transcriptional regulator [Actinoplanes sp. M2I2]